MKDPAQERSEVLGRLTEAVLLLEQSMKAVLIPAGGTSLLYAIRGARERGDVAAVQGGMVIRGGKVSAGGPCAFGADEESARLMLTLMKFDPLVRSVATLRFSEPVRALFEATLLDCAWIDRSHEPPGTSTMDWGVAGCCRNGVPDVLFDPGRNGKPACIHLSGEDPIDVANNIIMCSNRI
jgi:hydroxymethylpyrimidine/phosphomethylpyrimidine kinase